MNKPPGARFMLLQKFLGIPAGAVIELDPAFFQPLPPVVPPAAPNLITNVELTPNADGTLTLADERCDIQTLQIYRNGVRQMAGHDYRAAMASAGGAVIWPTWEIDATDTLLADYQRQ